MLEERRVLLPRTAALGLTLFERAGGDRSYVSEPRSEAADEEAAADDERQRPQRRAAQRPEPILTSSIVSREKSAAASMRMRFSTDLHFSKPPGSPVPARVMCSWYAVDHVNTHSSICTVAEASAAASAGESVRSALPMAATVSIGMARWTVASGTPRREGAVPSRSTCSWALLYEGRLEIVLAANLRWHSWI